MVSVRRHESGETLVEILIALVIMGLAITALVAGLAASSRTAATHRDEALSNTYVVQIAEKVKATTYVTSCGANPYSGSLTAPATGWTATATLTYWAPATGTFSGSCVDSDTTLPSYRKMQQITIKVTAPSGIFDSISVVKRSQS
jgi:Tfp pilus assembly protein PilV